MQTRKVKVQGRSVSQNGSTTLIRSSIDVDQLHVLFDNAEWRSFPVKVTYTHSDESIGSITQTLTLTALTSDEWAAESTVTIPWELMQATGSIALTFFGESNGDRIITAASSGVLTVVEAGAVGDGTVPSAAPTTDEWNQAYADAVQAASDMATAKADADQAIADANALLQELQEAVDGISPSASVDIATKDSLGIVQVGDGLTIDDDGLLSAMATNGVTQDQVNAIANLRRLAFVAFDAEFDSAGDLQSAVIKQGSIPIATSTTRGTVKPDGTSLEVGEGGTLSVHPDYIQGQLSTLDGALKYKGTAASVAELPDDAVTGDVYIVAGSVLFWDGEDWSEISSAVDLSAYILKSEMAPITAAEVHQVTSHHGNWGNTTAYVTQATLDAALAAQTQSLNASFASKVGEMEAYLDEQLEAILDGSY